MGKLYCQQNMVYDFHGIFQNLACIPLFLFILLQMVTAFFFQAMYYSDPGEMFTFEGSNGVPANGEPLVFHAFFNISCVF